VNLHVLPNGPLGTIGYLLTAPERGGAILIDAPGDIMDSVGPILAREKCKLTELWLTHAHWDHIQDVRQVVEATGARVRAHPDDKVLLDDPEIQRFLMFPDIQLSAVKVDHWLAQGQKFEALGLTVEIRHVPGHCPGNVLFYFEALKAAFVGDSLFCGGIGRTDLPMGDYDTLEKSIREQIYTLPEDTAVYPGHGDSTTVGDEREGNPYVSG